MLKLVCLAVAAIHDRCGTRLALARMRPAAFAADCGAKSTRGCATSSAAVPAASTIGYADGSASITTTTGGSVTFAADVAYTTCFAGTFTTTTATTHG